MSTRKMSGGSRIPHHSVPTLKIGDNPIQRRIQDFPEGALTRKGRQPIIWLKLAKNYMKMKKIEPRGGRPCPKFYYVDPPLLLVHTAVSRSCPGSSEINNWRFSGYWSPKFESDTNDRSQTILANFLLNCMRKRGIGSLESATVFWFGKKCRHTSQLLHCLIGGLVCACVHVGVGEWVGVDVVQYRPINSK